MTLRTSSVLFGLVVALCLGQIGWWIYFQVRETRQIERAAVLIQEGDPAAAARALGADEAGSLTEQARRRLIMFVSEGATLGLLVLVGVVFFYTRMARELRMRRAQERFLAGATHELKTPLATLRLGLESLREGTLPDDKRDRYLGAMVEQVDRLERDVTNLLTAAGMRDGERALSLRGGDLGRDLRAAIEALRPRFEAAGIELRADELPSTVLRRDPDAVRVIVDNLLDNALKYCGRGDRVTVTLRRRGDLAELRVEDTGPGLSSEDLRRGFERFYRGGGAEHVGGAGLGLHLVRQLAAAHGGTAEARSAGRGQGAEFVVTLPIRGSAP